MGFISAYFLNVRLMTVLTCAVLLSLPGTAQTREDAEKRIAALPADQQAFERFRIWIAGQPVSVRGSAGISDQQANSELLPISKKRSLNSNLNSLLFWAVNQKSLLQPNLLKKAG